METWMKSSRISPANSAVRVAGHMVDLCQIIHDGMQIYNLGPELENVSTLTCHFSASRESIWLYVTYNLRDTGGRCSSVVAAVSVPHAV